MTVTFNARKYKVDEPYGCRRGSRISRIDNDGTIHYEERCKHRTKLVTDPAREPVTLPLREANKLRGGETLSVLQRGEEARVVSVTRDGQLVQWRGDRFGG